MPEPERPSIGADVVEAARNAHLQALSRAIQGGRGTPPDDAPGAAMEAAIAAADKARGLYEERGWRWEVEMVRLATDWCQVDAESPEKPGDPLGTPPWERHASIPGYANGGNVEASVRVDTEPSEAGHDCFEQITADEVKVGDEIWEPGMGFQTVTEVIEQCTDPNQDPFLIRCADAGERYDYDEPVLRRNAGPRPPARESPVDSAIDDEAVGLLLKLANEAGGEVDVRRVERRRPNSSARIAFLHARDEGLVVGTGRITPKGYRWLGAWLEGEATSEGEPRG
jgi:hypothetical protein